MKRKIALLICTGLLLSVWPTGVFAAPEDAAKVCFIWRNPHLTSSDRMPRSGLNRNVPE